MTAAMTLTPQRDAPAQAARSEENHLWQAAVNARLARLSLPTRGAASGSYRAVDIGDVLITDWSCTHLEAAYGRTAAANDPEALLLFLVTSGRQIIQANAQTMTLNPGSLLVMSTRATGRFVIPESLTKRTVRVPLTALAPFDTGSGIPDFLSLDARENPLAKLTEDFITGVTQQRGAMTSADVEGARNAMLVLIAGMIRARHAPDLAETDFLPFLRKQLENWIIDHLADGAVRVGDLAAAHNVAPRTVHRAFALTGDTTGSVIRAHRLAAARNELVHTDSPIAAIAHHWGFCDASHLGREFRREFSMSPGDYRAAHGIA